MAVELRETIERARGGDREAFGVLYERFERSLYALCCRLLDDPDAAADATQEAFLAVWRHLPRLRHPEAFSTWLRGAAINACRHRRRQRRRFALWSETGDAEPPDLPDPRPGAAAQVVGDELGEQVRAALRKLSPDHREVIVLHHLEGLPLAEIAATLGVATGTVKSRLGRAREHLERLLAPYLES